jgi:hypothetical protein
MELLAILMTGSLPTSFFEAALGAIVCESLPILRSFTPLI